MVVGTLYISKQHAFVDTYLLSHWLIVFPCAGFSRKDAPLRPSVNDPNATSDDMADGRGRETDTLMPRRLAVFIHLTTIRWTTLDEPLFCSNRTTNHLDQIRQCFDV